MKRFERLASVTLAGLVANLMAWASIEGCGPDDHGTDGGDAAPDQTTDVANDVSPDVSPDVKAEAGDAGVDATAIVQFQSAYASAFCKRLSSCCYGAQLDASAPDAALGSCEDFTKGAFGGGFENAIGDLTNPAVVNSGHINVNSTAVASCLAGLATASCPQFVGSEYDTLAQNCLSALTGTVPVGGDCIATIECNNGYCAPAAADAGADAGGSKCVALSGSGQPCTGVKGTGNDECMYRGWLGSQQLRCDKDDTTVNTCGPTGNPTFKCVPKTPDAGGCFFEWECASGVCNDTCACGGASDKWTWIVPGTGGTCQSFFGADSGLN